MLEDKADFPASSFQQTLPSLKRLSLLTEPVCLQSMCGLTKPLPICKVSVCRASVCRASVFFHSLDLFAEFMSVCPAWSHLPVCRI